jgi:hypothetical protein
METTRQPQEVDRMLKSGKEVGIAGKFVCNTPPAQHVIYRFRPSI